MTAMRIGSPSATARNGTNKKERIRQKSKEVMKIIGTVIGHQLKVTFLISSIALIVIILLCSAAWYVLQQNSLDTLLEMLAM